MTDSTTPGFFARLEAGFEAAWEEVKTDAILLAEQIGTEIETDLEALWNFAAPLAVNAVLAEAEKVISGQEKFGNAVASVVQSVEAAGKPIVIADGQALVQNAYRFVQSKLTAAVAKPAG